MFCNILHFITYYPKLTKLGFIGPSRPSWRSYKSFDPWGKSAARFSVSPCKASLFKHAYSLVSKLFLNIPRWKQWGELKVNFIKNFDDNVIPRSYIYAGKDLMSG